MLERPGDSDRSELAGLQVSCAVSHNEQQLRAYIEEHCREGVYTLFQECAAGDVHNLCCFAAKGELVAIHEYHSIRQKMAWESCAGLSLPFPTWWSTLEDCCARAAIGMASPSGFLHQPRWQEEVVHGNQRTLLGFERGFSACRMGFPLLGLRYFLHDEIPVPGKIRIGSTTCWHGGDLRHC